MRLDKYLAHALGDSRRQVKEYIRDKRVAVNGETVRKDDTQINESSDEITFDGQLISYRQYVYYMLNKPKGVVSATMDDCDKTVLECFDILLPDDVFPIGRLDKDTTGLLIISNDGAMAHRLLSPKNHVEKTYFVRCKKPLTEEMITLLEKPLALQDVSFQAGKVEIISEVEMYLTIQEGKFHQVKRMVHHAGNEVLELKRVRFGKIKLDEALKPGEYRLLSKIEVKELGGHYETIS